jgi:nucleoside-diphosphate-sugar epimerase
MRNMTDASIRDDCLAAVAAHIPLFRELAGRRLAITGGTGFLGTWLAETIAALNDEHKLEIRVDVLAPNAVGWASRHAHLGARTDLLPRNQDVRSSFEFGGDVSHVIHAAGIPDGRVHSSDPLRVFQTCVAGIGNSLDAASKLSGIGRVLNVSSGLVYGGQAGSEGFTEDSFGPLQVGQVSHIYAESKRAAESLCAAYRSQFRMPVVTVRPFTFVGPYQELNRPWALNNFLRDALGNREIRVHGDGGTRRSYMYGSDAACWTLAALLGGTPGRAYNLGSKDKISIKQLAEKISRQMERQPAVLYRTLPAAQLKQADFFPSTMRSEQELGVQETVGISAALAKTIAWHKAQSNR